MKDIADRKDVELLINHFYSKVRMNKKLGFIFNDIAKVDWVTHLPKMYSFWASILLDERSYRGNPMIKHIALSRLTRMSEIEFNEWLNLFKTTVDENFTGPVAEEAKFRAANIANLMQFKIENS